MFHEAGSRDCAGVRAEGWARVMVPPALDRRAESGKGGDDGNGDCCAHHCYEPEGLLCDGTPLRLPRVQEEHGQPLIG